MTANKLADEKSPYLLQHAHNPVNWYPWGEEAFAQAKRESKPIFLSIGYSTCHWCHVMARESFEDAATAEIMNREFVNIKVDREERPDVDRVYMTFVQATTGGGGWPMSVWLTPDLKPFVGGTYFPPEDRYGQPGFKKVLQRIAMAWKEAPEKIADQSEHILNALREAAVNVTSAGEIDPESISAAYEHFSRTFDEREGGFGGAPKFPRPVTLNFLTRFYARDRKSESGRKALEMALFTLRKMAAGGIHDQLGGGFHRYSVDAFWHVPHFEKMLYDQAQLAIAYLDAFQITRDAQFESVARSILDYVSRDMTAPDGAFYSAEDADSPFEHGKPEHGEGAFYVWTKAEIEAVVPEIAEVVSFHYGVEAAGNAPAGADPQGEFAGKNILLERQPIAETATHFGKTECEIHALLAAARSKLLKRRSKRPRPHLDDKIITAWNGLMISAFARAAQVLGEDLYLDIAQRAAQFIHDNLFDPKTKVLARNFRVGRGVDGFADDYAFMIQALLDLHEISFDVRWLKFAIELQTKMDALFWDAQNGGYFTVTGKDKTILVRMKEDNDSAEPAASSVAALCLARMAAILGDQALEQRARTTVSAFAAQLSHFPSALPQMLVAVDFVQRGSRQIVIAGQRDEPGTAALLAAVRSHFLPQTVVLLADGAENQRFLSETNEIIGTMRPIGGRASAYVCEGFRCQAPVTDAKVLAALLE